MYCFPIGIVQISMGLWMAWIGNHVINGSYIDCENWLRKGLD